jgi:hypothetical protein
MPFPGFELVEGENVDVVKPNQLPVVPDKFKLILNEKTTAGAGSYLKGLLDKVAADVIDKGSDYRERFQALDGEGLKVSSWASGGGLGIFEGRFYHFLDGNLTTFFEGLFDAVRGAIPNARYSRNNFFHGHSVFDEVRGDVDFRIVFHAYEYPADKESKKSKEALKVEDADKVPEFRREDFNEDNPGFYRRNAIWSMRNNTLYIPNYLPYAFDLDAGPLRAFRYGGGGFDLGVCTMDQTRIGEEIIALNYFPSERVGLFLKQ